MSFASTMASLRYGTHTNTLGSKEASPPPASTSPNASSPLRSIAAKDHQVVGAGNDGISAVSWSPNRDILAATNWDGCMRVWDVHRTDTGQFMVPLKGTVAHAENQMPVLSAAFSPDGQYLYSGGCDNTVRGWDISAPPQVAFKLGSHDKPVKSVCSLPTSNLIVSGSWDQTIKAWDTRQPQKAVASEDLGAKIVDMDQKGNALVVATSDQKIHVYDVSSGLPQYSCTKESLLDMQLRCVSLFPDLTGYAVGSIGGRVGIQCFQEGETKDKKSFNYKCHRKNTAEFTTDGKNIQIVHAVNAISFHPHHRGTFATCGSDGAIVFWTKDKRQRITGFPDLRQSISCASFNSTGDLFAYACSYDYHKGHKYHKPQDPNDLFIHCTPDEEVKPKSGRTGSRTR